MFLLQDLPDDTTLDRFRLRYPQLDPSAVMAFLSLLRAGSELQVSLDNLLSKHGLLQGRWLTLILLARSPGETASPTELARAAGIRKATMTGLIDNLERDGFVERELDPEDRRKIGVRLTRTGYLKLDEVMPIYYERVGRLMKGLSEGQRADLIHVLESIRNRKFILEQP